MISFRDLENRVYRGKECVRFEYTIDLNDEGRNVVTATFMRMMDNSNEWNMKVILERTRDKDSDVYNFGYIMPKDNLPLELIAATGLKYFQLYLKQEVQLKSNLDFTLGNILQGM